MKLKQNNYNLFFLLFVLMINGELFAQHTHKTINRTDTLPELNVLAKFIEKSAIFKIEVPAAYLPISTNQISGKSLSMRGVQDIQQVARFLPGVRIRTTYGAFQQINIRGFDHSLLLVDGVRDERSGIGNSYPFPDLSSVESIELIKGPASVLYGQSAVGGVVNVTRKQPTAHRAMDARLSYGLYNYMQASAGTSGVLLGPVTYYAQMNYSNQTGWRDNAKRRFSGYLALRSEVGKRGELNFRGAFNRDYYSTEIGLPPTMPADIFSAKDDAPVLKAGELISGLNRKWRYNNESDFFHNNGANFSLQYRHVFSSAFKLSNRTTYSNDDINYFGTEDLSYPTSADAIYKHYYKEGNKKKYIDIDAVQATFPLRFSHMSQSFGNELEFSGKFEMGNIRHNYVAGYLWQKMYRNTFQGYDFGKKAKDPDLKGPGLFAKINVFDPKSAGPISAKFSNVVVTQFQTQSFYLHDLIELNAKLKLMLAGRYDLHAYKRVTVNTIGGERRFDKPAEGDYNTVISDGITYRAGLVYIPAEGLSVYTSAGSFVKPYRTMFSPNVIYIDADGKEFFPNKNSLVFAPEKGTQYEVGARYDINHQWSFNASVFYINKENTVRRLASKGDVITKNDGTQYAVPKTIQAQVGQMTSNGFDVEITGTPTPNLSFRLGYGYTDARIREIKKNDFVKTEKLNGKRETYVPQHTAYAYGDYKFVKGFLKNFGINAHISYQDKVYRNAANSLSFPAYWLIDAGVSYGFNKHIGATLSVNNLLNTEYYDQSLGNQLVPSMPRNFLMAITYTY